MEIRLQKFLAQCGIASRRNSEKLILEGLVQINGKIEKELGIKIDPEKDNIFFKGKKLTAPKCPKLVYILNKPKNCITSLKDEKNRDIISKYFPKLDCPLFPVGRLGENWFLMNITLDLLDFKEGSILETEIAVSTPLNCYANKKFLGRGELVFKDYTAGFKLNSFTE